MASVVKRDRSRFWTACFTDRSGRQLKRSTKTTDRNQALTIAVEFERIERQARAGHLTTVQIQKVFNDVAEKVNGETILAPTTETYLEDWLKLVRARNAARTTERYTKTVALFLQSIGAKATGPVTAITPKHVEEFLTGRLQSGLASKTVNVDLNTLHAAFRRAETYGIILKNPVAAVRGPKNESSERGVFTHAEVQKLLESAPSLDWQTLIMLGYFLGARLSDCIQMSWENVHPEQGVIVYNQKKTGKRIVVPMHYHLIEHLNHLSTVYTEGFLCPALAAKGPGGKRGLSEGFKRIVTNAGIDLMIVQGKGRRKFTRRSFHSLRHSFNSMLANAGVSEELRMKLTGHSSRSVHTGYTHFEVAALKNAVTAIPTFQEQANHDAPPAGVTDRH